MKIIQFLNQNNVKVNYIAKEILCYFFLTHIYCYEGGIELTLTCFE